MPEEAAVPKTVIEEFHSSAKRLSDEYLNMERKYKTASALNDTILKQNAERQQVLKENEALRKRNEELERKVRDACRDVQAKLDEERRAHRATQVELDDLKDHHERIQELLWKRPKNQ